MNKEYTGRMTCFIVPNGPINLSKSTMYNTAERIENAKKLCEANGMEFNPETDKIVELWYIGEEDFKTTNLCDHGGHVMIDGQDYNLGFNTRAYLPSKIFKDHKEGDTIKVKIPGWVKKADRTLFRTEGAEDCMFNIDLTLDQTHYRYARFGAFEDVLADIGGVTW